MRQLMVLQKTQNAICGVRFGIFLFILCSAFSANAAGPGVHGRVLGNDEAGKFLGVVPGATVEFLNGAQSSAGKATADENGYYRVELPPGEYLYRVRAEGYRTEDAGRGLRLTVSSGFAIFNPALVKGADVAEPKPIRPPMEAMGLLSGRVVERVGSRVIGIPNARVFLRRDDGKLFTVMSGGIAGHGTSQGSYQVVLPTGRYAASVVAEGFERLRPGNFIEIPDGKSVQQDFELQRPGPPIDQRQGIRGIVEISGPSSSLQPREVHVQIVSITGGSPIPVELDSSGRFVSTLLPGAYKVIAQAIGYPEANSGVVFVLPNRWATARVVLRGEVIPEPLTRIDVRVVLENRKPLVKPALSGVAVSVMWLGAAEEAPVDLETDASGHAVFLPSRPGVYRIKAFAPGYTVATVDETILRGQQKVVDLRLIPEAQPPKVYQLTVRVTDERSRQPIGGVRILARHSEDSLLQAVRGITNSNGTTELSVTRTGIYTILAQSRGYKPAGSRAEIIANVASANIQIAMTPDSSVIIPDPGPGVLPEPVLPVQVSGFVAYREANGRLRGVKGARLLWERNVPAQPPLSRAAVSRDDGRYDVRIENGIYLVRVEAPQGFTSITQQVIVNSSIDGQYFIVARDTGVKPDPPENIVNVRGVVSTSGKTGRDTPVPGAELLFSGRTSQNVQVTERTTSGRSGLFQVSLPAGNYEVQTSANGFETAKTQVRIDQKMVPLQILLTPAVTRPTLYRFSLTVLEDLGRRPGNARRPVSNAEVMITGNGGQVYRGSTDRKGEYSIQLNPGTYSARITASEFESSTVQFTVLKSDVEQTALLKRTQQPPQMKVFELTVNVTQSIVKPGNTKPAPIVTPARGASVSILKGSQVVDQGTTDARGRYSAKLPAGTYSIKVTAPGGYAGNAAAVLQQTDATVNVELEQRTKPTPRDVSGRR